MNNMNPRNVFAYSIVNTKEAKKRSRERQIKQLIASGHTKKFARQQVKRIN